MRFKKKDLIKKINRLLSSKDVEKIPIVKMLDEFSQYDELTLFLNEYFNRMEIFRVPNSRLFLEYLKSFVKKEE